MFKQRSDEEYADASQGGVRELFAIGPYIFRDTLSDEGVMKHFVVDGGDRLPCPYEVDRETMYEFLARYAAGLYEMDEYDLESSPGHDELLDVLEIATARARAGEADFSWDEFEIAESELLGDGDDERYDDEGGDDGGGATDSRGTA